MIKWQDISAFVERGVEIWPDISASAEKGDRNVARNISICGEG